MIAVNICVYKFNYTYIGGHIHMSVFMIGDMLYEWFTTKLDEF